MKHQIVYVEEIYAANSKTTEENSILGLLPRYLVWENIFEILRKIFSALYTSKKGGSKPRAKSFHSQNEISKMFNAITFKQFGEASEEKIANFFSDHRRDIAD